MGSRYPWIPQFGVDTMNGYFAASGSCMLGADVPPFHPSMPPPDHGGYGLGLCSGGVTASDVGAQFVGNNLLLASLAGQLYASASHAQPPPPHGDHFGLRTPPEEEMDGDYGRSGAAPLAGQLYASAPHAHPPPPQGDHLGLRAPPEEEMDGGYGRSGAATIAGQLYASAPHAQPPPPQDDHLGLRAPPEEEMDGGYGRSSAVTLACHGQSDARAMAPGSVSSSDSMASSNDQFSPGPSRSAVTHTSRFEPSQQQAYCPQPRFWPVHFAVVVARSPYAPVAQQALDDAVRHVLRGVADADDPADSGVSSGSTVGSGDQSMASLAEHSHGHGGARWGQSQRSELINLLQLMDEKYYRCQEEIQSTTAKFSGLMQPSGSSGGICAPFALRAVSSAYRALRRRITGEIMAVAMEQSGSWDESAFIQKHLVSRRRPLPQAWRPQRGLPERSVSVLKAWLFENFLHPYPQDSEKDMLAARSGLTKNQVANWFINARVRLWKPLIVELHEELKRSSSRGGGAAPAAMEHMSSQYVVG